MIDLNNAGEWKVRIEKPFGSHRLSFYFWKPVQGGAVVLQADGVMRLVYDGEPINDFSPTFSLSGFDSRQMMHALAEALADEDIKTPNDHQLKGQLEAQAAHLQDLRKLLKLNKTSGELK